MHTLHVQLHDYHINKLWCHALLNVFFISQRKLVENYLYTDSWITNTFVYSIQDGRRNQMTSENIKLLKKNPAVLQIFNKIFGVFYVLTDIFAYNVGINR